MLTQHASAILLDPEWGIPASKRRAKDSGLLLAYEKTGYDATTPGRLPDLLDVWSVRRLKEAGADCIKILLYYAPSRSRRRSTTTSTRGSSASATSAAPTTSRSSSSSSATKKGVDEKGARVREEEAGDRHRAACEEFTKDRYGVDVLKVEVPINMKFVEGTKSLRARQAYTRAGGDGRVPPDPRRSTTKPFIYLSAGVSNAEFTETLELAGEAGTRFSGVLCGRATWKDGIAVYGKQGGRRVPEVARDDRA